MKEILRKLFRPSVPESAMIQVNSALEILVQNPLVRRVRIFGSAQNGHRWDEEKSDIDLVIIMDNDKEWSCFTREVIGHQMDSDGGLWPVCDESSSRKKLRKKIKEVADKVELHIVTSSDLQEMKSLGGCPNTTIDSLITRKFHEEMLRGLLIFKKDKIN